MKNLYKILKIQAKSNPYKSAVVVKGINYNYTTINNTVKKLFSWLINNNLSVKDRVLFYGNNSIEFIISLFATNKARWSP